MNDNELGNHSAIWCHGNIIHALKSEHYADNSYTNDVFMLVWPKFSIACAPSRPFSSLPLSLFQFVHRMYSTRITWRLSVPFALYFESSLLWNQPTKKKKKTKKNMGNWDEADWRCWRKSGRTSWNYLNLTCNCSLAKCWSDVPCSSVFSFILRKRLIWKKKCREKKA